MELFAVVTVEVSAHMEKPRVRAGVMSALTQDAVALVMLCI